MKIYWDTSAAINAAVSTNVYRRLFTGEHVARLHLLGEFFATMTGRGVEVTDGLGNTRRVGLTPNECAAWLRDFAEKVHFEELTKEEALDGLDKAQGLSVQGARVYDYWHALVSQKAEADELLTRNPRHFQGLAGGVAWP